ncbi:beta-hydroxyacyl-ACP dehydratase [Hepatocystis sp. ex Piliocolobus tephrosceles]|nr:beta-hydroxyacyl-ACP dehydratase [Hepatocystis sp. ex Piliocolobus tephrosceles]
MMKILVFIVIVFLPIFALNVKKNNFFFLVPGKLQCNNIFNTNKRLSYNEKINNNINSNNVNILKASEIKGENISSEISLAKYESIYIEAIKNIIPHRFPFLLVDKVLHLEPNKKIIGIKQVTINEDFFNGHFPQKAIMPGVLQIEALAQLGGILCLKSQEVENSNNLFLFAGVDGVKWKKPVLPGDTLVMEVEQILFKPQLGVAKLTGTGYVNGQVVVKVKEMLFALSR